MQKTGFKSVHKMSLWKISVIIALAILMLSSGLMIAKLNTDVGVAQASVDVQSSSLDIGGGTLGGIGGETSESPDYSYLAHKYENLFVQDSSSGFYRLDLSMSGSSSFGITGSTVIDEADRADLNEYAAMIDKVYAMIADGKLYLAEDGSYTAVKDDASGRAMTGGKNNFVTVWESILWGLTQVPVGYELNLSVQNTLVFHIIVDGLVKSNFGGWKGFLLNLDSFKQQLSIVLENPFTVAALGEQEIAKLYNMLNLIVMMGQGLYVVLASIFGIAIAQIIDMAVGVIVAILGNHIREKISLPMQEEAAKHMKDSDNINTIRMKCNLVLQGVNINSYQY